MESKTNIVNDEYANNELTDEEIWEKYNISGGFREPGGRVAIPIKIEDMPLEIQEKAREVKRKYDEEKKHFK